MTEMTRHILYERRDASAIESKQEGNCSEEIDLEEMGN